MSYFKELPNIQVLNRTKNQVSNDETLIVKNIFKRAKLREDIISIASAFEYYIITENERPDQIAERIYGDSGLDWVILISNNIINIQDEWPLNVDSFNKYMLEKYGSESAFLNIHHYESISTKDSFGREVFPSGVILDEIFYNTPEYKDVEETPPGITFPPIYIPGTQAVLTPVVGAGNTIQTIEITNPGLGYTKIPTITISNPPVTSDASANCLVTDFRVSAIVNLVGGQGYNNAPQVTFSDPTPSVQATAECELGDGINIDRVTTIKNLVGGIGYGLTAPIVTFSQSPRVIAGLYNKESAIAIGNDLEGFYLNDAGNYLYTASFTGANQIKQYTLSTAWNIDTISITYQLDVSADFNYTTGVEFKPDGTIVYVTGGVGLSYKIVAYELSTPWDLSTATKLNQITIASPGGIRFKPDGTRMFVLDFSNPDVIREYSLGIPWNITTRSGSALNSLNITSSTGDNFILGFGFNSDGTKLFTTSEGSSSIYEYNLESWQINTATYAYSFYVGDRVGSPCDIIISLSRDKFLIAGGPLDKIYEYNLTSTAKGTTEITNGSVSGINITNPGVGYTVAPTITVGSPYPAVKATGVANLNTGIVTTISITNVGFGYTVPPTVTLEKAPISRKAAFSFQLTNTSIEKVTVTDGGLNYVSSPTITVSLPEEIVNIEPNDTYSQNQTTWRWTGSKWQEKITEEFQYFDPSTSSIIRIPGSSLSKPITNYEYESRLNEEKRKIIIIKPEYLPVVIDEFRNIMTYNEDDPNYINEKLKKTYNEKVMRI
jgi:hypothetical protein